jgi:hypothetical protein
VNLGTTACIVGTKSPQINEVVELSGILFRRKYDWQQPLSQTPMRLAGISKIDFVSFKYLLIKEK